MAKQNQGGGERSRIRLFYVEGDFAPGELRELTHAFSNAVRPTHVLTRGALTPPRLPAPAADGNGIGSGEIADAELDPSEELVSEPADGPAAKRTPKPRVYRKPEAVAIELESGDKSWKEFAAEKATAASSHRTKYLVAVTWLNEYRDLTTATADHVFTLYKAAGWNFDIGDPTGTFRQLRKDRVGSLDHGSFSVNHLGIAEVNDMKATA
jgi:hypothetical protein